MGVNIMYTSAPVVTMGAFSFALVKALAAPEMSFMMEDENMKKRTVTELLSVENRSLLNRLRYGHQPHHTYIYCRGKNIAKRFLANAEAEGFTFGDGMMPTAKECIDLYALNDNLTISYTGWAGHILFKQGKGNVVKIDYGKYIAGAADYLM